MDAATATDPALSPAPNHNNQNQNQNQHRHHQQQLQQQPLCYGLGYNWPRVPFLFRRPLPLPNPPHPHHHQHQLQQQQQQPTATADTSITNLSDSSTVQQQQQQFLQISNPHPPLPFFSDSDASVQPERRRSALRALVEDFVCENIVNTYVPGNQRYKCRLCATMYFPNEGQAWTHFKNNHRNQLESLISSLDDMELEHPSNFFTKCFYPELLYPAPPPPKSSIRDFPSTLSPYLLHKNVGDIFHLPSSSARVEATTKTERQTALKNQSNPRPFHDIVSNEELIQLEERLFMKSPAVSRKSPTDEKVVAAAPVRKKQRGGSGSSSRSTTKASSAALQSTSSAVSTRNKRTTPTPKDATSVENKEDPVNTTSSKTTPRFSPAAPAILPKFTEKALKQYEKSLLHDVIEEVVASLCAKLASRMLQEQKKKHAKEIEERAKAEEEAQRKFAKEQRYRARKAIRGMRKEEAEKQANSIIDEVIPEICRELARENLEDIRLDRVKVDAGLPMLSVRSPKPEPKILSIPQVPSIMPVPAREDQSVATAVLPTVASTIAPPVSFVQRKAQIKQLTLNPGGERSHVIHTSPSARHNPFMDWKLSPSLYSDPSFAAGLSDARSRESPSSSIAVGQPTPQASTFRSKILPQQTVLDVLDEDINPLDNDDVTVFSGGFAPGIPQGSVYSFHSPALANQTVPDDPWLGSSSQFQTSSDSFDTIFGSPFPGFQPHQQTVVPVEDSDRNCVICHNLPDNITFAEVKNFFSNLSIDLQGIENKISFFAGGRACCVSFSSARDVEIALSRNGSFIDNNVIICSPFQSGNCEQEHCSSEQLFSQPIPIQERRIHELNTLPHSLSGKSDLNPVAPEFRPMHDHPRLVDSRGIQDPRLGDSLATPMHGPSGDILSPLSFPEDQNGFLEEPHIDAEQAFMNRFL